MPGPPLPTPFEIILSSKGSYGGSLPAWIWSPGHSMNKHLLRTYSALFWLRGVITEHDRPRSLPLWAGLLASWINCMSPFLEKWFRHENVSSIFLGSWAPS